MRDPTAPPCAAEAVALAALRAAIRDEGLDRPTPVRALAIFALHVAMMFAGMIQFFTSTSVWLQALAFVVFDLWRPGHRDDRAQRLAQGGNREPTG